MGQNHSRNHCKHLSREVNCDLQCDTCSSNPNKVIASTSVQSFNYECPDCHGKFNQPVIKQIPQVNCSDTGVAWKIIHNCPFCGRLMEGL